MSASFEFTPDNLVKAKAARQNIRKAANKVRSRLCSTWRNARTKMATMSPMRQ